MCSTRRAAAAALAIGLLVSLGACGGGGGGGPTQPSATPVPTPTPASVISQGNGIPIQAGWTGGIDITTTRTGHIDVTVDWTYATDDVDVALTRTRCTADMFENDQCTFLVFSVSTTAKPEKIRAENVAPGTYTLLVENVGPKDESISYQVVLTPTTASGGIPPSASSVRETSNPLGQKREPRGFVPLR